MPQNLNPTASGLSLQSLLSNGTSAPPPSQAATLSEDQLSRLIPPPPIYPAGIFPAAAAAQGGAEMQPFMPPQPQDLQQILNNSQHKPAQVPVVMQQPQMVHSNGVHEQQPQPVQPLPFANNFMSLAQPPPQLPAVDANPLPIQLLVGPDGRHYQLASTADGQQQLVPLMFQPPPATAAAAVVTAANAAIVHPSQQPQQSQQMGMQMPQQPPQQNKHMP